MYIEHIISFDLLAGQTIANRLSRRINKVSKALRSALSKHNSQQSAAEQVSWEAITNLSNDHSSDIPRSIRYQAVRFYHSVARADEEEFRLLTEMRNTIEHYLSKLRVITMTMERDRVSDELNAYQCGEHSLLVSKKRQCVADLVRLHSYSKYGEFPELNQFLDSIGTHKQASEDYNTIECINEIQEAKNYSDFDDDDTWSIDCYNQDYDSDNMSESSLCEDSDTMDSHCKDNGMADSQFTVGNVTDPHYEDGGNWIDPHCQDGLRTDSHCQDGMRTDSHCQDGMRTDPHCQDGMRTDPHCQDGMRTDPHCQDGMRTDPHCQDGLRTDPHSLRTDPHYEDDEGKIYINSCIGHQVYDKNADGLLFLNGIAEKTLRQFADIEEESSDSDEGDMEIQHWRKLKLFREEYIQSTLV